MVVYNFKKIQTVPPANNFVDIILTRTQRKTPTVIHPTYAISRIRAFYMRKVKFTQQTCQEKLSQIIDDFPRLDDIHPFYADLINILYDKDHYKLALGQINTARALVDNIAKDYVRMIKYGDTLYRCKQLKRAALGRICTLLKKNKSSLDYLEEVRKHLSRLPSIDPNTRTLLVTGFPNVGKSSFMNKVTRADVDVQPYAFTTKALYVGHMDYKYLRWQVIDTPGILDHPLEQRNTIEMQAVTALAHLQASVLFFLDISEQCGFTIEQQLSLFANIRPLFANKPLLLVCNKIDQMPYELLPAHHKEAIEEAATTASAKIFTMSNHSEENVSTVKNYACDELLSHRVSTKVKGKKVGDVLNRLTVAMPVARDEIVRDISIPDSVLQARDDPSSLAASRKTQKQKMVENGGAGVYAMDYTEHYEGMLKNKEWRHDVMPEIWNGKNLADFVDPDILARLDELEREEEALDAAAADQDMEDDDIVSDLDEEDKVTLRAIRDKKHVMIAEHRQAKNKNRSVLPRKHMRRTLDGFKDSLDSLGVDSSKLGHATAKAKKSEVDDEQRGRKRTRDEVEDVDMEGGDDDDDSANKGGARLRSTSVARRSKSKSGRSLSRVAPRDESGFRDEAMQAKSKNIALKQQRKMNKMAKIGEADRHQLPKLAKWQNSGKRGNGNTNSR